MKWNKSMSNIVIMGNNSVLGKVKDALSQEFGKQNVATTDSIFRDGQNLSINNTDNGQVIETIESIEDMSAETTHLHHLCDDIICVNISQTTEPA